MFSSNTNSQDPCPKKYQHKSSPSTVEHNFADEIFELGWTSGLWQGLQIEMPYRYRCPLPTCGLLFNKFSKAQEHCKNSGHVPSARDRTQTKLVDPSSLPVRVSEAGPAQPIPPS